MVNHIVPERIPKESGFPQGLGRRPQGLRNVGGLGVFVHVAGGGRRQFHLVLDPLDPCGQHRGLRKIGVQVRATDPAFDPHALGVGPAQTETGRAVVDGPDGFGGGKGAFGKAFVAVHVRRQEKRVIRRIGDQPGHIVFHQVGHAQIGVLVEKRGRLTLPQRLVHVAGTADAVLVPLGQERRRATVLPGDFLDRMFRNAVVIGAVQCRGIANVQLFLPGLGLALGVLDGQACCVQMVADRAHHAFFLGGLEDIVIFVVAADRRQIAKAASADFVQAFLEQEKLQLGGHLRVKTQIAQPRHLLFQDRAWVMGHGGVGVMVQHIAQHQCSAFQPRHSAQRGQVGGHDIVAISRFPTGRGIAIRCRHLKVGRQQIVAAMGLFKRGFHEVDRMKPLAHQTALHVHKTGQHRVDAAVSDAGFQVIKAKVAGHVGVLWLKCVWRATRWTARMYLWRRKA